MALEVFDEAEQLATEDRDIWHNKGMCHLYLKQYEKSLECFEAANSIQRHESTYMQMGRVYRLMGKDEEALNIYMEALEICPENAELLTTIGLLFLKLGNNTKAFEFLGNSLTYDPKNAKTILAAGSIIQDNQDMDVALVKYRVAAVQTPNSAQLWNNIGMCFFGKGNTAINLQPTYARAYTYLALALSKLEDFENSCAAYDKALELSDDYFTHLNYAITLYTNDEIEKARKHFAKFDSLFKRQAEDNAEIDPDVRIQADLLRKALA
eukprot:gene4904-3512_t